jgi:hypothetical protein
VVRGPKNRCDDSEIAVSNRSNGNSLVAAIGAASELIEQAIRRFFDERQCGHQRLDALRSFGQAVDQAALHERVLIPVPIFPTYRSG